MQKGQVLILILAGVLVIAALVGGAYYFAKPTSQICIQMQAWAKSPLGGECKAFPTPCDVPKFWIKCTPPAVPQTPQPSPSPDETVYTESDRSAYWKTYTSSKYNYSISYPTDAQIVPEGDFKIFIKGKSYPYGTYVTIDILNNPKGLSLSQLGNESYATDSPSPYDLSWQKSKFLGMDVLTTKYNPPGDSGEMIIYLFEKMGTIYSLWKAPVDEPNSTYFNDLADSILSTFKFTN